MKFSIGNFCRESVLNKGKCPLSEENLIIQVALNFDRAKKGYRDGVLLVPINPLGFFSPVVELKEGDYLFGKFKKRVKTEEPRKTTSVLRQGGEEESRGTPATSVDVVLYSRQVLEEDHEEVDPTCDYEIVTILPKICEGEQPMPVETLLYNHFHASGGTKTNMSPEEFEASLKKSFEFWRDKAMLY